MTQTSFSSTNPMKNTTTVTPGGEGNSVVKSDTETSPGFGTYKGSESTEPFQDGFSAYSGVFEGLNSSLRRYFRPNVARTGSDDKPDTVKKSEADEKKKADKNKKDLADILKRDKKDTTPGNPYGAEGDSSDNGNPYSFY
jgi:hypothetical protein